MHFAQHGGEQVVTCFKDFNKKLVSGCYSCGVECCHTTPGSTPGAWYRKAFALALLQSGESTTPQRKFWPEC